MELIRKLPSRRDKKGCLVKWAIFWCDYCKQEVEKILFQGIRDTSCGCKKKDSTLNPMFGKKHTEETRQKIGFGNKGKIILEETRQKIAEKLKGRKSWNKGLTKETDKRVENISKNNTGKKQTEEIKNKKSILMSGENNPMFGKYGEEHPAFGYKHTTEHIQWISSIRMGENNPMYDVHNFGELAPNWVDGKSFEPYSPEFNKEKKQQVLERDNYECQNPNCEHLSEGLDVHHIDYNKKNSNLENLTTLCDSCHTKTNGKNNRQYWTNYYQSIMINRIMECLL